LHPTMTDEELDSVVDAVKQISIHHKAWARDYLYNKHTNEFMHINEWHQKDDLVSSWFQLID